MDKNIGEQLNKAYEAYRQACMDRDHAVKELQQKTENYMHQIHEQQEKIELQNSIIAELKSELAALNANRGNAHPYILMHEDIETSNLPFSQLSEKLNMAKQREKFLKEHLESESMKLKQLEDKSNQKEKKLLSIISNQEDKIRNLKSKLKELNEAQKGIQMPAYKREVKSKKVVPDKPELSLEISGISPMPGRTGMYNRNGLTDGSTAEEPAVLQGGGLIVSMKK
ncbi:PREDICTED: TRAF family member-associated NF-kappa-B activator-like [Acanthisitta chloris]|uniref:TRAF family member-associated NF-kappa-B activator-like n=1 Tax=Acanthisitta chloris TaxID=57068 RepID=UPI0004F0D5A4|nr:PREDICTED: TRAF family member-associated NF-kappa-B activator-like [Acanthisitta chloris]